MVKRLSVVVTAIVVGIVAGSFVVTVCSNGIARLQEELGGVNETIHSSKMQVSLLQYTDDPQDFRDSIEQWSLHLQEMTSLGRNIVAEILNEQPLMKQSSYLAGDHYGKHLAPHTLKLSSCLASSAVALPLSIACLSCGYLASDLLGTFLVSALLSSLMGCLPVLKTMASMNDGMREILGCVQGGKRLGTDGVWAGSNANDEYLQLMLFVTGPGDLGLKLLGRSLSRHVTFSSHKYGWAFTEGCVPVTWDVMRWSAMAATSFVSAVLLKRCIRFKTF
ncbi:hypothetical protein GUITHDRAFT_103997 [Guillardia theta CCMP2712]|uniref:Uncharacterized protein n=1 Tax=Guillardia theta (strain CCMP2712) TaxID=905079 RepID=L1JPR5_GUITC|nr:hypothetical protein GUITHDRAFT_103997 [Guillardia theta CCMP2712]EKX50185.1 hypothetical protein GUITHDRAFT_103997 [Guillardia theta CCMP2712]|eukprot:XP_005837165.1 hypothetical protein GUITHDRAFT_103997 [Guillardia theta CCMP2712]